MYPQFMLLWRNEKNINNFLFFLFFFYEKCSLSGALLKYCMKVTKHEWSSSFSLKMWPYSGSFVGEWYML